MSRLDRVRAERHATRFMIGSFKVIGLTITTIIMMYIAWLITTS